MQNFTQTFQTAGYVSPLGHISDDDIRIQLATGWAMLETVNRERDTDRDHNDYYDQFKTALHGIMHNRSHQSEY